MTRFLIELIPDRYRDAIIGDIVEESRLNHESEEETRRRIHRELLRSIPRLFRFHYHQDEDDSVKHAKWIAAAAIIVIGVLQALDSGILNAPPWIGAMAGLAIAVGIAGVFSQNDTVRLAHAAVAFVLLVAARIVSPVPLPDLMLVGLPIFLILVLVPRFQAMSKEKHPPRGPGTAA